MMRAIIPVVFIAAILLAVFSIKSGGNVEMRHPCDYGDCNLETQ